MLFFYLMETKSLNESAEKKQYENPEMDVLILKNEGVICTSGYCDYYDD